LSRKVFRIFALPLKYSVIVFPTLPQITTNQQNKKEWFQISKMVDKASLDDGPAAMYR